MYYAIALSRMLWITLCFIARIEEICTRDTLQLKYTCVLQKGVIKIYKVLIKGATTF